ncbi:uncharacterized protein PRCAT00000502001 [Priceomyces carsonii]|uniref:uncharacterized protein n=1 Tax=Priceomyces carsonii TaxID=28549 RepID=UPI002ED7C46C|nr:unnamed protein product [Priceomyces carsonii]
MKRLFLLPFLLVFTVIDAIGISVAPIQLGDQKRYSGLNNLLNCLSYSTEKDDMVVIQIKSGDKQLSQSLNLNIFDNHNYRIRYSEDIQGDVNVLFKNLNTEHSDKKGLFHLLSKKTDLKSQGSAIYICFDNLYEDKSWTFHPKTRDIEFTVDIKNRSTIHGTNYQNFASYFPSSQEQQEDGTIVPQKEFAKDDFEKNINALKLKLADVKENLKKSEYLSRTLVDQEFKLRDVNENIFSGYTLISIVIIVVICIFGIGQAVFFWVYLKRKRII